MSILGKHIIENLTTGMYEDSNIIFREYIQNSADQIDKAISSGILLSEEACIDINISKRDRTIKIYDNATGIPKDKFKSTLGDLANSEKDRNLDKGFRGIGRLGGLAYCDELVFCSSYIGEDTKMIMRWNGKLCREILYDTKIRCSAEEVLSKIIKYEEVNADIDEHFFEVQLININEENTTLLDSSLVSDYLSLVAPVPYKKFFLVKEKIYTYANNEGFRIDEYKILINGEQLFKSYSSRLYIAGKNGKESYDEITDISCSKIKSNSGELLAWMWIGVSKFEKQIPNINIMRGIRVRKNNIQIGDSSTLNKFFKEPRGNYYFVGEIFAVHNELIPNSRRDYFNENRFRSQFEYRLYDKFIDYHSLYRKANDYKAAYTKQIKYSSKVEEFNEKKKNNKFINEKEFEEKKHELDKLKKDSEQAKRDLERMTIKVDRDPLLARVYQNIENEYKPKTHRKEPKISVIKENEKKYLVSDLSKLNKREQNLVRRIYEIIKDLLPNEVGDTLINKIQEELKK